MELEKDAQYIRLSLQQDTGSGWTMTHNNFREVSLLKLILLN